MMTTIAALFGAVPLALGSGTGSELRRPLGITIIGGLLFSQLLTLYTTPVVYLWFDRLAQALRHLRAPKPAEALGRLAMNISAPAIRAAGSHYAADPCPAAGGSLGLHAAAGLPVAAGGLPGDRRIRFAARRQSGDHGFGRGHSAGAAVRPHRRHQPDDLGEPVGIDRHHHAVRSGPQHRCRGA